MCISDKRFGVGRASVPNPSRTTSWTGSCGTHRRVLLKKGTHLQRQKGKSANGKIQRCGKKPCLTGIARWQLGQDILQCLGETHIDHLVGFVQDCVRQPNETSLWQHPTEKLK